MLSSSTCIHLDPSPSRQLIPVIFSTPPASPYLIRNPYLQYAALFLPTPTTSPEEAGHLCIVLTLPSHSMDGSSSNPGPLNSSLPPPTFYQVPPAPGYHWQDHLLVPSSVSALPPIPPPLPISSPPRYHQLPSYHQLYNHTAVHYAPPFPPALGSLADSIQQQPRITQGPFSYLPQWQPDHLVRNCPICDNLFTLFFRRHHCRSVIVSIIHSKPVLTGV